MSEGMARELSKWMSMVANKYNTSIMTVINEFKKASEIIEDVELVKIFVIKELSKRT